MREMSWVALLATVLGWLCPAVRAGSPQAWTARGSSGMVAPDLPLSIEDLVLPPHSPCRGAGENGANIGPRWEKFLGQ